MSRVELLATDEPRDELETLIAALEELPEHGEDETTPSEPAPVEPGEPRPAACIWRSCDAASGEWHRCERRARVLFGFLVDRKGSREAYCLPHAIACLRTEGIKPAKVWNLGRGRA